MSSAAAADTERVKSTGLSNACDGDVVWSPVKSPVSERLTFNQTDEAEDLKLHAIRGGTR